VSDAVEVHNVRAIFLLVPVNAVPAAVGSNRAIKVQIDGSILRASVMVPGILASNRLFDKRRLRELYVTALHVKGTLAFILLFDHLLSKSFNY